MPDGRRSSAFADYVLGPAWLTSFVMSSLSAIEPQSKAEAALLKRLRWSNHWAITRLLPCWIVLITAIWIVGGILFIRTAGFGDMTQTDKIWWEEIRAKGRVWYVFREGVLRHGVHVSLWLTLLGVIGWIFGGLAPSIIWVALAWAVMTVCFGALIGVALWNQHEKNYQKMVGNR